LALSKIRRYLIAAVGILLLVDLALLGLAWSGVGTPREPETFTTLIVWLEDPELAEEMAAAQKAAGRKVSLSEGERTIQLPDGYRLLLKSTPTSAQSIFETLKFKKRPVTLSEDKKEVHYGEVFSERSKAESEVQRVLKADGIKFTVAENHKEKMVKAHRLVLSDLDSGSAKEVTDFFEGKGLEVEVQSPTSDQPEESE
jgi:hypothetical protein